MTKTSVHQAQIQQIRGERAGSQIYKTFDTMAFEMGRDVYQNL